MDILSLITNEQLAEFASAYDYKKNFMGDKLFPSRKTNNLKVTIRKIVENGNLPVMAQVHALDAEARIGDRPNFDEIKLEKVLIKEKLPLGERIAEYLGSNATKGDVVDFIFDDANSLISRNLTRAEVAKMELLATGKVTYKENNIRNTVDYGVPSANTSFSFSNWNTAATDILADVQSVISAAEGKGYKVVRAITSSTVLGYMLKNTAIKNYWATSVVPLTKDRLLTWLNDNFGIEFVVNDDLYKLSATTSSTKRFYPANKITFLTTRGVVGASIYGVTPEERQELSTDYSVRENMFVTLTRWKEPDPATVWMKGSSVYVPVLADPNGLFIATVSA